MISAFLSSAVQAKTLVVLCKQARRDWVDEGGCKRSRE